MLVAAGGSLLAVALRSTTAAVTARSSLGVSVAAGAVVGGAVVVAAKFGGTRFSRHCDSSKYQFRSQRNGMISYLCE